MPLLIEATYLATRKLPKVISPKAHKAADYLLIGGFALAGMVYWNRDRRAAIASMLCGGSLLALTLATQYDGKSGAWIGFSEHRKTELGMAGVFSLIPKILQTGKVTKTHFLVQAAALTAIGNMTRSDKSSR